ncbi:MAG: fatty acid desaturase [Myxococcota bacterium]
MLRYAADLRTVAYMIVTSALLVWQWQAESFNPWVYVAYLHLSVAVTVISHNHNHLSIWKSKVMNRFQDYWLTVFYGFPVFGWIPTHNLNHHKFTNRDGDYTQTFRYTEKNNLFTLLTYPSVSSFHQQKPIKDYLAKARKNNRSRFWWAISQYVVLVAWIAGALFLDWRKGLLYVVVPQQVALFAVLAFNYLQHVHANEESEFDHSRNIVGPLMNLFLFNNGYHTIHHMKPGLHWSKTPEAHAKIADKIDPRLNEPSFWWLVIRTYLLAPFIPAFRSKSMRLERMAASADAPEPAGAVPTSA